MARNEQCSVLFLVLAGLLVSQSVFFAVTCTSVEDQKTYYPSPDPHTGTGSPPTGSHGHGSPPHGSGGGHHGSPHHGSGGSHGSSPPSHGGGVGCTNPPNDPHTPSVPSHTPTPSVPSHNPTPSVPSYTPTPSVPSHTPTPSVPSHTPTPSVPSHTPTPSVPSHTPTPSVPSYTPTPSAPSGGYYHSPPATPTPTPVIVTPTPPSIPSITPTPFFDPNHPFTGTCTYWMNHPTLVWGVMGWWGTLGSAFGGGHSLSGFPSSLTLPQALSNTRTDGLSSLYREGTASFLNSMVNNRFHFTTQQVRDSFVAALSSDKAAAAQARVFKLANEGRLKPRA